jgi:hypothetical protein
LSYLKNRRRSYFKEGNIRIVLDEFG